MDLHHVFSWLKIACAVEPFLLFGYEDAGGFSPLFIISTENYVLIGRTDISFLRDFCAREVALSAARC